jgi:hypothetical protein
VVRQRFGWQNPKQSYGDFQGLCPDFLFLIHFIPPVGLIASHTRGGVISDYTTPEGFFLGDFMESEKDLLQTFGKLTPENRASLLAFAHVTHEAQENTRRALEKKAGGKNRHEPDSARNPALGGAALTAEALNG